MELVGKHLGHSFQSDEADADALEGEDTRVSEGRITEGLSGVKTVWCKVDQKPIGAYAPIKPCYLHGSLRLCP